VTSIQEILTGTPSQEEEEPDLGLTGKINDMATQLEIIDQNIGRAPEGGAGTQPLVDGIYGYVVNVAERLTTLEENVGHPAATTPKPVPITGIYEQLTDLRTLVVKMRAIEQTNNILTSVPLLAGYAGLICAMHEHIMFTQLAANGPTMPTGTWEHAINGPSNNDDCRTVIVIDTSTPTTRNGAIYALDRAEQTRITIIDGNATTPTCKPTDLETDIQLMRSEHHTNQIHEFMLIRCADFLLSGTKPTLTSLIGYAYDTIKKPYDLYVSFPHNAICGAIQPSLISEGRITHIRYLATQ
jgi:hypothetical protein